MKLPMIRFKKPLIWGLVVAFVVLLAMSVYGYFVGTRTLLEHAEAFTFRRMAVTRLEGQGSFRFFFATNRQLADPGAALDDRYSNTRQEALSFGHFDTQIEPSLGLGILIDPSDWFLNEEIQIEQVRDLLPAQFVDKLRQQVEASPERSLLIAVHGFREAFPSALRKTAFLSHVLDIDTPVLLFDWPGNQGTSLRGYRRARQVALDSGAELAALLSLVVEEIKPERIWLVANSMGGQPVVKAFEALYQDSRYADSELEFEDVVLTAPDVDQERFNTRFKQQIKALTGQLTVYVSSNDRALLVSRIINRGQRLGESNLDPSNPGQTAEAVQLAGLIEPGDNQLVLVDVTPVNRTRNFHNFTLETPEFFSDLFLRLKGHGLPTTRELYSIVTPEGAHYYVLTRGR